jgi:ABC-type branched-subunit amino acid transport system ATPase component/ABC-type branched-subunit amino acid transport system permease subunit
VSSLAVETVTTATPVLGAQTVHFAILGVATGALIGLVALSIVIVHRASGVLNFSAGAFGGIAAFLFYSLRDEHGVNWILALIIALLTGAALGLVTHFALYLLRRLSQLAKLIATLALMSFAQGFIVVVFGDDKGSPLPFLNTRIVSITSTVKITEDRLILIALALGLAVVLGVIYSKTMFGLATSAVNESPRVAATSGWSSSRIELANFALAGTLSAAAAILLAPIVTLQGSVLALLVVPALAAAFVGRFASFPITVAAAMLIGVLQNWTTLFQPDIARGLGVDQASLAGLPDAIPLAVIIIAMVLRGAARQKRSEFLARLPLPGEGRINWILLVVGVILGLFLVNTLSATWADAFTVTFAAGILVLSIVVVTGYGGQLSLAPYAMAGFGCWVASRLAATQHWPFMLVLVIGVVLTIPAGLVIALPALRTRGVNLAVATLVLALMIQSLIFDNGPLTGGFLGTQVSSPTFFGFDLDPIGHPARYATFALGAFVAAGLVVANLRRGRAGQRLMAVRGNERAAAGLGVGVYGAKLYAFGLSAGLAALSGIILGFRNANIQFGQFTISASSSMILNAVIGGIGWTSGAIIAGFLAIGGVGAKIWQVLFNDVTQLDAYLMMISGGLSILTLKTAPDGLAALHSHLIHPLTKRASRFGVLWGYDRGPRRPDADSAVVEAEARPPVGLEVRDISVAFGGVVALNGVSFTVEPGEIVGLMGPNGAGKTTMLDVITGFTKARSGDVSLAGNSVNRWSPERRARFGVSRSWQSVELFDEMSVLYNLLVAVDDQRARPYFSDLIAPGRPELSSTVEAVIADLGLEPYLDMRPSGLSHGTARLVGIARAMVARPTVLLLDEPAAGLDATERVELARVIRHISTSTGVGILLIEHDVPLIMSLSNRIVVLDFGSVIATGSPEEVAANPDVIRAYLGEAPSKTEAADEPSEPEPGEAASDIEPEARKASPQPMAHTTSEASE